MIAGTFSWGGLALALGCLALGFVAGVAFVAWWITHEEKDER